MALSAEIVIQRGAKSHVVRTTLPHRWLLGAMLTAPAFGGTLLVFTLQWASEDERLHKAEAHPDLF